MQSSKVTLIGELLLKSLQAPTAAEAINYFQSAYNLNKASEQEDELLIEQHKLRGLELLQKQPDLSNFSQDELLSLYPNKFVNLEVLSPSNLAVKQLKRELNC